MQLTNTRTTYGWIALALHWIAAAGVIWLYLLGDRSADLMDLHTPEGRTAGLALRAEHVSFGALLFIFLAGRVIWALTQPKPAKLAKGRWIGLLARSVQYLFLAMIAVQIITGPAMVWLTAKPIQVFNWFAIPSPFHQRHRDWHEAIEPVHTYSAKLLWPLLILHVLGTAKSLVIDRDRTLQRMLWVRREHAAKP